jgi:hypothetical protein
MIVSSWREMRHAGSRRPQAGFQSSARSRIASCGTNWTCALWMWPQLGERQISDIGIKRWHLHGLYRNRLLRGPILLWAWHIDDHEAHTASFRTAV